MWAAGGTSFWPQGMGRYLDATQNTQIHVQEAIWLPGLWHSTRALVGQRFLFVTVDISHLNIHGHNQKTPALQVRSTPSRTWHRGDRQERAGAGVGTGHQEYLEASPRQV